jgi:predicted N-acyltransferase
MNYRMQICQSINEMSQAEWNSLVYECNGGILHPALRHEYLWALESCSCATTKTGWTPLHLALYNDTGNLIAAMPLYLKFHSFGEFVFDWAWAKAYEREGLNYYPKLLSAIPFTPVLAPKLLHRNHDEGKALAQGLAQLTSQAAENSELLGTSISTLHALFLTLKDQQMLLGNSTNLNASSRHVVQFHWRNQNMLNRKPFKNFNEFLENLNQKKRKNIRAERRKAHIDGLTIQRINGTHVNCDQLEFFYQCYAQTYIEHFSKPYLNLEFFDQICKTMGDQIIIIQAKLHNRPIASALFLYNKERLYGRYWGCIEELPCLHFELCYYQAIEFAIEQGIEWFEGGAQGEHKMARGLNPTILQSAHYVPNNPLKVSIENFLEQEKKYLQTYATELSEHNAFVGDIPIKF